jgi:hypothetical protein
MILKKLWCCLLFLFLLSPFELSAQNIINEIIGKDAGLIYDLLDKATGDPDSTGSADNLEEHRLLPGLICGFIKTEKGERKATCIFDQDLCQPAMRIIFEKFYNTLNDPKSGHYWRKNNKDGYGIDTEETNSSQITTIGIGNFTFKETINLGSDGKESSRWYRFSLLGI